MLDRFRIYYYSNNERNDVTIDQLRAAMFPLSPAAMAAASAASAEPTPKKTRNVKWHPGNNYTLIKPGLPLAGGEADIPTAAATGMSALYVFRNTDPGVERNPNVPLYEATYYCADGGYHVRAQKCHLKRVYTQCGRTDKRLAWTVDDETGVPYWVDRYAFSKY